MIRCICFLLIVFSISLSFSNCNKANAITANTQGTDTIAMSKTACYGKCPVYTVKISSDGKAIYEGKMNVAKIGVFVKVLAKDEATKLFKAFNDSNFENFQDRYDTNISDIPSTITTYTKGGKVKVVFNRRGGPQELKTLEKLVEEIGESEGWQKQ